MRNFISFRFIIIGAIFLSFFLLANLEAKAEISKPFHYDSYFLWAGVKSQVILENAKTVYILAGEVRGNDNKRIVDLRAGIPKVSHADIWMTIRVERIDWDDSVFFQILGGLRRWEANKNRLKGLQIDFDAATLHLKDYSEFLKKLRRWLPPKYDLSITGLMDWGTGGNPMDLKSIGEVVDEIIFQTYQGRQTIPNYEAYLQTLQRVNFSYRIGIVQGGDWQEPIYLATDPNFKGYVVFLLNPHLPLKY